MKKRSRRAATAQAVFLLLVAVVGLASCGEGGRAASDDDVAAGHVAAGDTTPIGAVRGPPPAPVPPSAQRLALEGEGLRVFDAQTGAARPLPFGTDAAVARPAVEAVLGVPPMEEGENADCGIRYATWPGGLSLSLRGDRFVGWSLRGDSPMLTTPTGVGIGSTRADLEAAHVVDVAESSLGTEFSVGGMAGVLESPAPESRITALWAGEVCLAR